MHRRAVRYSLLSLNLLLLVVVVSFVWHGKSFGQVTVSGNVNQLSSVNATLTNPLDQLSSADIAQSVASLTSLPEAAAVRNQAETVNAELAVTPSQDSVIPKPQIVATALKSRRDIQNYITQPGDSLASLASKFNVTSNSIKWSNSLTSNSLSAGTKLVIPPVNGIVYTVKSGDTADSLAKKYSTNADQITFFNDAEVSGLQVGEQIVIPNGQPPATPVYNFLAIYGSNGYDYGFCTWYVATQISVPSNWGNASSWSYYAALSGWTVGSEPQVGAIAQTPYAAGGQGHVAVVRAVNPNGTIWISEMNSSGQVSMTDSTRTGGWGVVDWKVVSASTFPHYIYH